MAALKFVCKTSDKKNHEEIKRRTYMSGGSILREKIMKDTSSSFQGEFEIISEGGTLYREVKETPLCSSINIINF
jgi:hypothetical protein